ncbi:right-handed parallel beta-helix repeat-containing protein [Puia sp.]|jgi:hypothetical protein|uniref:right-handed parallel beta-helix repeat-containing protein n=1 Tax=Puia sp. TaxID=2045100 RepID=UPI002F3F6B8B
MMQLMFLLFLAAQVSAKGPSTFYVAPDGNDKNPGTKSQPFATIQKAQTHIHPGDTVYLRGGTYRLTDADITRSIRLYACVSLLDKSGDPGKYLNYFAYPGETPVFNYEAVKPKDQRVAAFYVTGSYIHLKGFEVTGVQVTIKTHTQSECFENHGSNNIYENLRMHDGMAIGFYLLEGSDNLILNCDAYRNFDYYSENGRGGNTDGFGCHPAAGSKGNVFRECRAWFNSDDGYDVINSHEATTFDHCWSFYNGYTPDFTSEGDGNGFKGGGFGSRPADQIPDPVPQTTVRFCLAVHNKASGFYSNHHITGSFWYNNTAYRNHIDFNMLNRLADNRTDVPGYKHVLENNLGYKGGSELANIDTSACHLKNNSFQLSTEPTEDDFISLDEAQLTKARNPDGSLPGITLLHPRAGSPFASMGCFPAATPATAATSATAASPATADNAWIPEIEQKPGANSRVYQNGDALIIDTKGGATVWYNKKLTGNFRIDYDRTILIDTGSNDRLSDCNQFWMAGDPHNPNLFTRTGKLEDYNNVDLYYVGMGGNTNKTTRFRKYGGGARTLIKEYLDAAHLLQKNRKYHITITVSNGTTAFLVDGSPWFTYTDPTPLTSGYFGFRSTWSRQMIKNFTVTQLP